MKASYKKYILNFKLPAGTSRGVLKTKETFFIKISNNNKSGIGECSVFRGLSYDDVPNYEQKLQWVCNNINLGEDELLKELTHYPSIQFGIETAFLDLKADKSMVLFPSNFTNCKDSISINGLIWMGEFEFMMSQISEKLKLGFNCIKMKIGAIDFDKELEMISNIRKKYSENEIEIRVDANGAFNKNDALKKLKLLAKLNLHSIEQPIKQGQELEMANLCKHASLNSVLDIALDEELIGVIDLNDKIELLNNIKPQYIILKPSLIGGIKGSLEWIKLAEERGINWWITSALESNIGLNAIAQFTYTLNNKMHQGLGTGSLFTNNITSPLFVENGRLFYNNNINFENIDF